MADARPIPRRVILGRAFSASALAASTGAIAMAQTEALNTLHDEASLGLTFASRMALVAWRAAQAAELRDGLWLTAGPIEFVTQTGATAIADLPGLIPATEITPAHFGFDLDGTASANAVAVKAALLYANGRPTWLRASTDFICAPVEVSGVPVDLRFEGSGWWDITDGGGAIRVVNIYEATQAVFDLAKVSYPIEGAISLVHRVTVLTPSAFARGDVVKVFSNEIEPAAAASEARRKGEFATVIDASEGDVLITLLQDSYGLRENVRIAKLRPTPLSVSGLKVKSATTNGSVVLALNAPFRPRVEMDVLRHGAIIANIHGSYEGEFHLTGSGFTNQPENRLGYLVNDSNGWHNRFWLRGKFFRHTFTSNHQATVLHEDAPEKYGRTRRPWVTGISESTWGAAWDTHAGCEEAIFENCVALGAMSGFDNVSAFQLRGIGGTIIDGYADNSFDQFLRLNSETRGTIRVINPTSTSDKALTGPNDEGTLIPTVLWTGGNVQAENASNLFEIGRSQLRVLAGARLAVTFTQGDNDSIFRLRGSTLYTAPDTLVRVSGQGTDFQVVKLEAGINVWTGGLHLHHSGVGWRAIADDDGGTSTVVFKAVIEAGAMVQPTAGSFVYNCHAVQCMSDPATSVTNLTTLDEFVKTLGTL